MLSLLVVFLLRWIHLRRLLDCLRRLLRGDRNRRFGLDVDIDVSQRRKRLHQILHIEREVEADVQVESPAARVLYELSIPRNHANRYGWCVIGSDSIGSPRVGVMRHHLRGRIQLQTRRRA